MKTKIYVVKLLIELTLLAGKPKEKIFHKGENFFCYREDNSVYIYKRYSGTVLTVQEAKKILIYGSDIPLNKEYKAFDLFANTYSLINLAKRF